MITHLKFMSVPVADQDRALKFYTEKLGFKVATDQQMGPGRRWIELRMGKAETRLVLFTMDGEEGRVGTRYPLSARQVLYRRGAQSDALYVVLSGSLFVLDDSDPVNEIVIDQLGPDTLAGEQEILTKEPRRATVRAAIDSVLLRLTSEDLGRIFAAEPRLAEALAAYGQSSMDGAPLRYALSRS